MKRYNRNRRDNNERPLVVHAERLGAHWYEDGPLDGWTYFRGIWTPTEIKDPAREGKADAGAQSGARSGLPGARSRMSNAIWVRGVRHETQAVSRACSRSCPHETRNTLRERPGRLTSHDSGLRAAAFEPCAPRDNEQMCVPRGSQRTNVTGQAIAN